MKIERIELIHCRVPLVEPFRISSGAVAEKRAEDMIRAEKGRALSSPGERSAPRQMRLPRAIRLPLRPSGITFGLKRHDQRRRQEWSDEDQALPRRKRGERFHQDRHGMFSIGQQLPHIKQARLRHIWGHEKKDSGTTG